MARGVHDCQTRSERAGFLNMPHEARAGLSLPFGLLAICLSKNHQLEGN